MSASNQLAYVFPGQGSQQLGMLADIAELWPQILNPFAQASEVLGFDLWAMTQSGSTETLNLTQNAQPALLTSSVALYQLLGSLGLPKPNYLAGHSLGEWSALVCADVIDLADAVRLVHLRGQYMQAAVPVGTGTMAAILGLDDVLIEQCCLEAEQGQQVAAVNYNSPGQVVIAGHTQAVERAIELCKSAGAKRAMLLPVSAPFHTQLMKPAAEQLASVIEFTAFRLPTIPVIHNVGIGVAHDVRDIKNRLIEQIYSPVPWVACVQTLIDFHVERVVEVGPGKVLAGLIKRIQKDMNLATTDSVSSIESLLSLNAE